MKRLPLVFFLIALVACGTSPTPTPTPNNSPSSLATNTPIRAPLASATLDPANNSTRASTTPPPNAPPNISKTDCPLTGLPLKNVNLFERRPLLVKLGNSPAERPQSGLAQADVVFEHITEGGITRFSAVYYCGDATNIGPIRSGRFIDLELVPMLDAIFAHVGASDPLRQLYAQSEFAATDLDDYGHAPIFRELTSKPRPFNRYSSTNELWKIAKDINWFPGRGIQALAFSTDAPSGGKPAHSISIPYGPAFSNVTYEYNSARNVYLRADGSSAHVDAESNQQLATANVVVLFTKQETTNIEEDSLHSLSIRISLTGSGKAIIFRNGQMFEGAWTRTDAHAMLQFADANGIPLTLNPGNTWFEVVREDAKITTR